MAQNKPKAKKLSKAEREHIDNQVVLATAIGLVSAIFMTYLYRWLNSAAAAGTLVFTKILMWALDAGIAICLVLLFWKKEKRAARFIPYFVGGSFLLSVVAYSSQYKKVLDFLHITNLLNAMGINTSNHQAMAFVFVYICIAAYLIASYIYFGCKIKKGK